MSRPIQTSLCCMGGSGRDIICGSGGRMNDLTGKTVIVETGEITYEGKLIEIGEEEVQLESELGWVVIPVARITSVREKEA